MKQYKELLTKILTEGHMVPDRTGVGTTELFGEQIKFDLEDGFPLLSGKATNFSIVKEELRWMLSGSTNVNGLDSSIWDNWRSQYTVPREIVEVKPIEKEYEPYDFISEGTSIAGLAPDIPVTLEEKLAGVWKAMMQRCYNTTCESYPRYGGVGVSVCKRWHILAAFIADAQQLPHWGYKQADWSNFALDKDYYSSNQYSPETCVWLRHDENTKYTVAAKPVRVTNCYGDTTTYLSVRHCADTLKVAPPAIRATLERGAPLTQGARIGWKFEWAEPEIPLRYKLIPDGSLGKIYGHNFRHLESGDQIAELVAGLKKDPHSRRHIVSSWFPESNKTAALAACHTLWQVNVAKGKINLHMYQRSCDIFLGAAYNIAFYALLLELLAFETGNKAGVLTISYGSVHVYNNHLEQVDEYLSRGRHPLPTLNVEESDICAATFDVDLVGYSCGDKIPAPVAV